MKVVIIIIIINKIWLVPSCWSECLSSSKTSPSSVSAVKVTFRSGLCPAVLQYLAVPLVYKISNQFTQSGTHLQLLMVALRCARRCRYAWSGKIHGMNADCRQNWRREENEPVTINLPSRHFVWICFFGLIPFLVIKWNKKSRRCWWIPITMDDKKQGFHVHYCIKTESLALGRPPALRKMFNSQWQVHFWTCHQICGAARENKTTARTWI